VRGQVLKVDGKNITMSYQSDSRLVPTSSDVRVYALVVAPKTLFNKTGFENKPVEFKDIKVGDNLEMNARVLQSGQIEGYNIIILPSTVTSPAV
jgi:hypothetical protein